MTAFNHWYCSTISSSLPHVIPISSSGDAIVPPLSQAVGYVVVVGLGLAFALGMIAVTRILKRTMGEDNSKIETYALLTNIFPISHWL